MSVTLLISAAIVITSCVAFVVIGTVYRWDVTARGYARWTQIVGVLAVLGLAGVAAYARRDDALMAGAIGLGGIVLAALYVVWHRRLAARVRDLLAGGGTEGA